MMLYPKTCMGTLKSVLLKARESAKPVGVRVEGRGERVEGRGVRGEGRGGGNFKVEGLFLDSV